MKSIGIVGLMMAGSALGASHSLPRSWADFEKSHASSMENLFDTYKASFQKSYESKESEKSHFDIFVGRAKSIFDFNAESGHSYAKGLTKFADLSDDERKLFVMKDTVASSAHPSIKSSSFEPPKSKGIVNTGGWSMNAESCDLRPFTTSVKDQQSCGSCWAFGTMAAAEASHFLWAMTDASGNYNSNIDSQTDHYRDSYQLAEQVLVECCHDGCNGCGGGGTFEPMQCAVDMGALPTTASHPYLASNNNSTCTTSKTEAGAYVQAWYEPCSLDEACLKSYIGGDSCNEFYTTALKTSIEVISSFYDYVDGVYSDPACPDTIHNHAVAIVGWGTDDASGKDYWIIRNSWGSDWGQDGYILMERGNNMCCVACENLFFQ